MKYYNLAIISKNLNILTYSSEKEQKKGNIVEVTLRNRVEKGLVLNEVEKPAFKTLSLTETPYFFDEPIMSTVEFIASYYVCKIGEAAGLFFPKKQEQSEPESVDVTLEKTLSAEQKKAYAFVLQNDTSLLFGDTGSGKSEIYFELIAKVLQEGGCAVVIMPEISLTPQMEKRLKENFGDIVAIWHSKVTKKKKETILDDIYGDKIRIVAGARSALFLPLLNVKAIIVDEEHENSFKSQSKPRINARDLAVFYGQKIGAKVVLGSATPSLKSYEKYPTFRLKGRFFESQKRVIYDENEALSPRIIGAIKRALDRGEQALVFNPTRGDFKYLFCKSCKTSITCPYCDISMTLHLRYNAMKCHYCNYTSPAPKTCPECESDELMTLRAGTSNLKSELEEMFGGVRVEKFDRDAVTSESKLKKILSEFNKKEIDILVGTQMLSKGHDYHNVSLAVVLGVDYVLNGADFAARERAMSLLVQVAGRSGRKLDGDVIVQTYNREFFEKYINDYDAFLEDEKAFRKDLYPPFVKMATVRFEHSSQERCRTLMEEALAILEKSEAEIVGHGEASIKKIAAKFRYIIILRSESAAKLNRALWGVSHLSCDIDVDPENFS